MRRGTALLAASGMADVQRREADAGAEMVMEVSRGIQAEREANTAKEPETERGPHGTRVAVGGRAYTTLIAAIAETEKEILPLDDFTKREIGKERKSDKRSRRY